MVREAWWATCDPWEHKESDTTEQLSKDYKGHSLFNSQTHTHDIINTWKI